MPDSRMQDRERALDQQRHQHRAAPWPEPNWRDDARCKAVAQWCPVPRCSSSCTVRNGVAGAYALDDVRMPCRHTLCTGAELAGFARNRQLDRAPFLVTVQ